MFKVSLLGAVSFLFAALLIGPALAQDSGTGSRDRNVIFVDCSQVQQVFVSQGQYGDANAVAVGEGDAVATISQRLDISQSQVNACLGNIGGGNAEETTAEETTAEETTGEETTGEETTGEETTAEETTAEETTGEQTTVIDGQTILIPDKLADTTLPETGGPSGIALAAGCALLGVGLIINRIFR